MMKSRKWTLAEQTAFLKKTGELLERGYPLSEAIHSMTFQMKKGRRGEIAGFIDDLREGYPFYKILERLGFNKILIGYVYYAERHGSLALAFREASAMMLKRHEDLQRLKKISFYPLFLMALTLFMFIFVEKFLLPGYATLYQTMNLTPNLFMKMIWFAGEFMPLFFALPSLCSAAFAVFYFAKYRFYAPLKKREFLVSLPVAGGMIRLLTTHYFATQFGYLLSGGLSVLEALQLFAEHKQGSFDSELGKEMGRALIKGETLAEIAAKYSFFENNLPVIIRHGEENGKLPQELDFYGKHCLKVFEEKVEGLIKKLQPVLYSLIGFLVISMYLAILLPMFQLLNGI